jgi:hypothetical protein
MFRRFLFSVLGASFLISCGDLPASLGTRPNEAAHGVGYVMGTLDEMMQKTIEAQGAGASAGAASSCASVLSTCVGGKIDLSYEDCLVGPLKLKGLAELQFFGGSNCSLLNAVRRQAAYSFTGRNSSRFEVSVFNAAEDGQTLTRSSSSLFFYSIKNLRRKVLDSSNKVILDLTFSVEQSNPLIVTGLAQNSGLGRKGRRLSGGPLKIKSQLDTSLEIVLNANALDWGENCTCPVSGSWSGSYADSERNENFSIEIKSCGVAELRLGGEQSSFALERCLSL